MKYDASELNQPTTWKTQYHRYGSHNNGNVMVSGLK